MQAKLGMCLPALDPVQRVCSLARTRARLSVPCTLRHLSCSTSNTSDNIKTTFGSEAQSPQVPIGQTVCLAYLASAQPVLGSHSLDCSDDNSYEFEQS